MSICAEDDFRRADVSPMTGWLHRDSATRFFKIQSNSAAPNNFALDSESRFTTGGNIWSVGVSFPSDQYCAAGLTMVGGASADDSGIGLVLRSKAPSKDFYRCVVNKGAANNVSVYKFIDGTGTLIGRITTTWADNDELTFEAYGTNPVSLLVFKNKVQIGTTLTDTAPCVTGGSPGIGYSSTLVSGQIGSWYAGPSQNGSRLIKVNALRARAFAPGLAR